MVFKIPVIFVHLWEGRTVEQKQRFAMAVTEAATVHFATEKEGITIIFEDHSPGNWSAGGKLFIDTGIDIKGGD
jgi:4-oxalocrotonate tautomerase